MLLPEDPAHVNVEGDMFAAQQHHRPIASCSYFIACFLLSAMASAGTSVALSRKPRSFLVGTKVSARAARGFLYIDDCDISPPIMATVTAVR
jgi:hypothetical protein